MKPIKRLPDAKRLSRGWSDEMTAEAISRRLDKVSQLYAAWKVLSNNDRHYRHNIAQRRHPSG